MTGRGWGAHRSAIAIVDELTATLDPEFAPELAENLTALYGFAKRRLHEAHMNLDPEALASVKVAIIPSGTPFASLAKSR